MFAILWTLVIGGVAGWLAGNVMRGGGFGLLGNVAIGVVGSFVGGALLWLIGLKAFGIIGGLIAATLGAIVLLAVASALQKR
jgi:uncharacterized membrane protein YeaQ/YmgE (transglycosylase-associated protein family)